MNPADTSLVLNLAALDEQSKIDTLMNMIREQRDKLNERDRSMSELLEKVERDRSKLQAQTKEIEQLKLSLSQHTLIVQPADKSAVADHSEFPRILNTSGAEGNLLSGAEINSPQRPPSERSRSFEKVNEQLRHKNLELVTKLSHLEDVLRTTKVSLERCSQENASLRVERDQLKITLDELNIQLEELKRTRQHIDGRIVKMKSEYTDQRSKLTEHSEQKTREHEEERKRLEEEFATSKTALTSQKQRLELENKALGVSLTAKTNQLEMMRSEYTDLIEEKEEAIATMTAELTTKEQRLKETSEQLFGVKKETIQLRTEKQEAISVSETLKTDLLKREEKCLELQQQCDNLKKFSTVYLEALEKDVQASVQRSTTALVNELEFYKTEYRLLKEFLHEIREVIRSRGPLQNWINSLFPE